MTRRVLAALIAAMLAMVACGDDGDIVNPPVRVATMAELTGPWRATPLLLDPALRARVAEVCRREMELPPGVVPAVIDARGESVVTVRMTGVTEGRCDALVITGPDDVEKAGGGWRWTSELRTSAPDTELTQLSLGQISGGALTVRGWSVHGQAGAAIAVVQVAFPDGLVGTASLENGWFSAWWPAIVPKEVESVHLPQFVIRAFDRTGALLDSATLEDLQ